MKFNKTLLLSTLLATTFISQSNSMTPAEKFAYDYFAQHEQQGPRVSIVTQRFMALNLQYPLHEAARCGLFPILKELIRLGHNVNERDAGLATPLHWATAADKNETVFTLLEIPEVDVNAQDNLNMTALHLAVIHGNIQLIKALSQAHGIILSKKDLQHKTPLMLASEIANMATGRKIAEILIQSGATE